MENLLHRVRVEVTRRSLQGQLHPHRRLEFSDFVLPDAARCQAAPQASHLRRMEREEEGDDLKAPGTSQQDRFVSDGLDDPAANGKEEEFSTGPLSVLMLSVKNNTEAGGPLAVL